jgi:FMN phosphatase YigB (HAD superfamily)
MSILPAVDRLRPRFLPDRDAPREWGVKGALLARLIRKGFAVPPSAAMGLTQVTEWLQTLPEYEPAIESLRPESAETHSRLLALEQAILGAPMPEHWPRSAGTLRQLLCGDPAELKSASEAAETWPLILRSSMSTSIAGGFESVVVRETTAENLWRGFTKVVAGAFRPQTAQRSFRVGVLIQPRLIAELSGRCLSTGHVEWGQDTTPGSKRFQSEGPPPELAPFWDKLWLRARKAEKIVGGSAELKWIWDGAQLWFVSARAAAFKSPRWRDAPVKTLLVDLDGTLLGAYNPLVRAEFMIRGLWRLRRHGGLKSAARSLRAVTEALERPMAEEQVYLNAERGARAFARTSGLPLEEAGRVLQDEVSAIFPELKRYFYPVKGAREFIEWARTRYRLILATNPVWPIEQVKLRLDWAGIDPEVFSSITHSGRMHACKPLESYYREVLEQEGLDASECALVGDDITKDLPATRVGISVFILDQPKVARKNRRILTALSRHGGSAQAASGTYTDFKRLLLAAEKGAESGRGGSKFEPT